MTLMQLCLSSYTALSLRVRLTAVAHCPPQYYIGDLAIRRTVRRI